MRICEIKDCDKLHLARGWCGKHYWRWRSNGDPLKILRAETGHGHITQYGYKVILINGKKIFEHRFLMEKYIGRKLKPFPDEIVHHINHNTSDNRIKNLELMSQSDHRKKEHGQKIIGHKKECTQCGEYKHITQFYILSREKRLRNYCKSCVLLNLKIYRLKRKAIKTPLEK